MSWDDLETIIDNAGKLSVGWDSYTAKVPSAESQKIAKGILEIAAIAGAKPDRVAPDVNGGFHIKWKGGAYSSSLFVFNNGKTCLLRTCEEKEFLMVDEFESLSWAVNMALHWVNRLQSKVDRMVAIGVE